VIDGDPLTYDQTRQFPSISILHISEQDGWPKLPIGSNGRVGRVAQAFLGQLLVFLSPSRDKRVPRPLRTKGRDSMFCLSDS